MQHFIITILIIISIISIQILFFIKNRKKQTVLKSIFPVDCNKEISLTVVNKISVIVSITESRKAQSPNVVDLKSITRELEEYNKEYKEIEDQLFQLSYNNNLAHTAKRDALELEINRLENELEQIDQVIQNLEEKKKRISISNLDDVNYSPKFLSPVFNRIISTINNYLIENKSAASDFHLIKDIVDRNCDSIEEEIITLTPIPLYLGLIGTMIGILVGVGSLVISGGIEALLSTQVKVAGTGIVELLGGVAIAMLSSIVGILLTTTGSFFTKESKISLNNNKNSFLSWIQVKLLPTLTDNNATTLYTLQKNLTNFNNTFAINTRKMGSVFSMANHAHQDQLKVMEIVERLDVTQIAKANVKVLNEIQSNVKEFEKFNHYLHSVTDYLDKVQTLSSEINQHLNRTKVIEDMGLFFKTEIEEVNLRKAAISKSVGEVDITLQKALQKLQDNAEEQINEFIKASVNLHIKFSKIIEDQQDVLSKSISEQRENFNNSIEKQYSLLHSRMEETSLLIEELKNLSAVKVSLAGIEKATKEQNQKLSFLTTAIENFAKIQVQPIIDAKINKPGVNNPNIPILIKVSVIFAVSIMSAAALLFIVSQFLTYFELLTK